MAWHIVVDGVVDPRPFKDSAEFTVALKEGARAGVYPEGAEIRVRQEPDIARESLAKKRAVFACEQSSPQLRMATEFRPVFVYERRVGHGVAMTATVFVGILIGLVMRSVLGV